MRKLLLALALLVVYLLPKAQPFGNEWIDYTQTHYKIKVWKDGIYRVPYSVLSAYIPNITSLNTGNLVLYHNGEQVPIYVTATNLTSQSDYVEFYGRRNRGDMDSVLYKDGAMQPHTGYSLFTDTSIYYLSVRNSGQHLRYTVTANNLTNLPPKENYFIYQSKAYFTNRYFEGKYYYTGGEYYYKSVFDEGEGYLNLTFFGAVPGGNQVVSLPLTLPTPAVNTNGPAATFKSVFLNDAAYNETHKVLIDLNGTNIYTETPIQGFRLNRVTQSIPLSQLTTTNTVTYHTDLSVSPTPVSSNQNGVYMQEIDYPRNFDFSNQDTFFFSIDADAVNRKYIEITNFNDDGQQPVLYDITNNLIIHSVQSPGTSPLKFALPASSVKRNLYLISGATNTINSVSAIYPINFQNYADTGIQHQASFIIISDYKLYDDGSGNNWVEQYRQYRDIDANPSSGKFYARTFDIDQLYEQFGYGIRKSPLAIRNFIHFAQANWHVHSPAHVLLIGKGREYTAMRASNLASASSAASAKSQCQIPTFGFPGSDNLLPASRTADTSNIAIGRIAAETPAQVKAYLDKLEDYESQQNTYTADQPIEPKIWQKQVLHFSGGTGAAEQSELLGYLTSYKTVVQGKSWGANVTTFSRTSSAPIDASQASIISGKINEGASLLTFFGHSATGAFDFSIDEPENYRNYHKFPVIISNGCFSGYTYDVSPGYSERFVLQPQVGAIAFLATTSLSQKIGLNNFTSTLYNQFCHPHYVNTLGACVNYALKDIFSQSGLSDYSQMVAYEMTLHGDPGITLNQYPKPDYAIEASSVWSTPSVVLASNDSFQINISIANLGKAIDTNIAVTLTRRVFDANNNTVDIVYRKVIAAPYYYDTISFTLPTGFNGIGYGQNLFGVKVDADNSIDEMAEFNNELALPNNAISLYIQSDDVIPIYPYEFSIVPQQGVVLKASTVNPFSAYRSYVFQIDTTEKFTSPQGAYAQTGIVSQVGGVLHWQPSITLHDSVVYYWRVGIDSSNPNAIRWHNSSFIYIHNEYPGWNQSHYYQWKKDNFVRDDLDSATRIFKFPPNVNNIHVLTGYANAVGGNVDYTQLGWQYNSAIMYLYRTGGCGYHDGGITFAVIDAGTGLPWKSVNQGGDNFDDTYWSIHCDGQSNEDQYGFDFPTTGSATFPDGQTHTWSYAIDRFLSMVPNNDYILAYGVNQVPYSNWGPTLLNALHGIGMSSASTTLDGPFIFFTQKGNAGYPNTFVTQHGYATGLEDTINVTGAWYQGQFSSPLIGPARGWQTMKWDHHSSEPLSADRDTVDIFKIDTAGVETLLMSTTQPNNNLTNVNARVYPYMRLRLRTTDTATHTPTQMDYWRIVYDEVPEAAVNPAYHFKISDSVILGGNLHVEMGVENVTPWKMDSLLTKYTLRDAQFNNYSSYVRYDTLGGLDSVILILNQPINGANYQGLDKFTAEINPNNDQREQFHFNNYLETDFHTTGDKINPLLDVTFDGQHIFNNDIVSAKPDILITLKDENQFLPLNDTTAADIYIKYPNEASPRRMSYDNIITKFYPADSTQLNRNNRAQVEIKPEFTVDGTYELTVRDKDRSGNHSSTENRYEGNLFYDYKMDFQVITKSMVTNVLNYPNPFTTSTRFVFTLTGSELPQYMKIQIMTIKGTVVKEITMDEMGPLHIGTNMTEYAWDGRDQYGDILANGVYFYRVVTRIDNKQADHLNESYDKYFKKGFGKLVIIR